MPRTIHYNDHILIVGPGLDEILEPGRRILLFDEFYADIYGDYVFLGYDVATESIITERADLVGLYTASVLLDSDPSIIVCGKKPSQCLLALASHLVYHSMKKPLEALKEAINVLEQLYYNKLRPSIQGLIGLTGLYVSLQVTGGASKLSPIIALASNYEYGHGRLHYGETVSWLAHLGANKEVVLAALLHFLVEGHGSPRELLERRLSAIGRDNLVTLLGDDGKEAIDILQDYANNMEHEYSRMLALIEILGPGEPYIICVDRRDGELIVYCKEGSHGEPVKDCVLAVGKASKLLPLREIGLEEIRITTKLDLSHSPMM